MKRKISLHVMTFANALKVACVFLLSAIHLLVKGQSVDHAVSPANADTGLADHFHKIPEGVLLNTIYFRVADLAQGCAGVTYERYLVTKVPMSILISYSHSFLPAALFYYKPDFIIAAGFRYQFMKAGPVTLYVLPELVYAERSLSFFRSYTSPAAYFSGGAQYKKKRLSLTKSFGVGLAGDAYSYSPSVRLQLNIGYAF